jgi:hypothetical protein
VAGGDGHRVAPRTIRADFFSIEFEGVDSYIVGGFRAASSGF